VSKKLRLALSLLLLTLVAWRTDWRQAADAFAGLRPAWWLLGVGVYAATQVVSSVRWRLFAAPLGFRRPVGQFVALYYVGMFFNLVLPTSVGGDVVRAWYLDGGSRRRLNAFVSVLAERGSGLAVLVLLACAGVLLSPRPLPGWVAGGVWVAAGGALVGLAALPLLLRLTTRFDRIHRLAEAARLYLADGRLLVVTTLLSVVVQAANVLLVWMVGSAIGAPVPGSYYWVLVPLVTLLTLLPVSLNGMGVREGATVLLLAPLGVSSGTAVSLALLWFAAMALTSLFGAPFYLLGQFPRFEGTGDARPVCGNPDQGRTGQPAAAA
jgi:uncharacterized membrane protein YbhN (UPF0104 family)